MNNVYNINDVAKKIADYCLNNNKNYVFIAGNGTSGKTTLSNKIKEIAEVYGKINIISLDDFMIDKRLRNSTVLEYQDQNGIL